MLPVAAFIGYQVALKPPVGLRYVAGTTERARSTDFYQFLASIVPNPGPGTWYASTPTFGNRLEATALTLGTDCLLAVTGDQPMRREGVAHDGRPRLRRAGPWNIDYVRILNRSSRLGLPDCRSRRSGSQLINGP